MSPANATTFVGGLGVDGNSDPITVRYGGDWGHVRLAGMLRKIGYETRGTVDNEPDGHETGWGIDATTAIRLGLATGKFGVVVVM